ncbi:MAG: MBL fold metallo-hydrolase [Planctomycetes bacterium]|nr:MBL fold metallo-hydrolase [Planctomycetota bacterium]
MRTIQSVLGNSQKLDGGAMYGNCPRALWSKWSPPDEKDRIDLACRAMLVREPKRLLLFETGIGAFFSPELRERFGVVESRHVLLENLRALGIEPDDIDVVVLSHLHFDHAGGLLAPFAEGEPERLLFAKARYVVGKRAYERACAPHSRDRASFIPALPGLLQASGRLELADGPTHPVLGAGYRLHTSDGHTPGLLLAEVASDDYGPVLFAADLIPGVPWVHLPITMGYDRYPELLIDEKRALLEDLLARDGALFFTHDPQTAIGRVQRDAKGKFGVAALA